MFFGPTQASFAAGLINSPSLRVLHSGKSFAGKSAALTTSNAIHGRVSPVFREPGMMLRSQGSVRRVKTTCGSEFAKSPICPLGGYTEYTSAGFSAKRGPATEKLNLLR
jgi:hypothetical protein